MRDNTQVCEICLGLDDTISTQVFPCDCSGPFHQACVEEWHVNSPDTCPICKKLFAEAAAADESKEAIADEESESESDEPDVGRHEASCAEKFLAYSALAAVLSVTVYLVIAAL